MIWGAVLRTHKRYTQQVTRDFRISQAALDTHNSSKEVIEVSVTKDNKSYIVCNLQKGAVNQVPLDLNFSEGEEVTFTIKGEGVVHLTGYLMPDEDPDFGDLEDLDAIYGLNKANSKKSKKEALANGNDAEDDSEDDDEDEDDDDDEDDIGDMSLDNGEDSDDESDEDLEDDDDDDDDELDDDSEDEEAPVEEPKAKVAKIDSKKGKNEVNGEANKKDKQQPGQKKQNQQKSTTKVLKGGVQIEDVRVGQGIEAKPGKKVQVYYEGRLKSNNQVFDSSKNGPGFKFSLGKGEVIKGWDIGVAGMKIGGKRRIICPPQMAYGAKGSPPVIPPNATLIFEVELKKVH